jgi:glyoxylase-like metal-dependent hydrolase (beta-lactamase superfamily II)
VGRAGSDIIAHENTRLWLGADFHVYWQDTYHKPLPKEALPTTTFYKTGEATFGREDVRYGALPRSHTDGDIYIFFPRSNVLVVGDTLAVGTYPLSDTATGGWLGGMIDANKAMLDLADADTKIVPGTGPVQTRADLQAQHDMLSTVMERLVEMMAKGMSADEMVAARPTREFDEKWGDPTVFVSTTYRGLWANVFALGARVI